MLKTLKSQIGGDHYSSMKIQPAEFILANNIGHYEAAAIEYLCRWKNKNGVLDLIKAEQCITILIEHHEKQIANGEIDEREYKEICEQNDAMFKAMQGLKNAK